MTKNLKTTPELQHSELYGNSFLPVGMNRNTFVFVVEFDQAEGCENCDEGNFPSPTESGIEYTSIEQIREAIPVNGVRVWCNPDIARMARADTDNHFALVDFWLQSDLQKTVAKLYPDMSYQEYLDCQVELLRELMEKNGERVWWSICGEQDDGVVWPRKLFSSKREAYKYFEECNLTNIPGRYPNTNRKMTDFKMLHDRYHVDFAKDNIAMQVSKCFSTHYPYEWGARLVWCERTGNLGSAQIVTAFMRGAANQHDGYWGIDISGWGGIIEGACFYDKSGAQLAGVSNNLILRQMIAYYYSGANLIHLESTASSCWIKSNDGSCRLSPYGEDCRRFGEHSLIKHPERGIPLVPFAVMLEHDHGWDPRDHRLWGGCVEYGPGDQMIDDFFNFVFPGQEIHHCLPETIDDHDYIQYRQAAAGNKIDEFSLSLEEGLLAASRYGDSFDVVLENCPLEVLRKYPVLVICGAIKIDNALKAKLREYVAEGGELILNTTHMPEPDPKFTGTTATGEYNSYSKFHTSWKKIWDEGPTLLEVIKPEPEAEVVVTAKRGYNPDAPAIVRKRIGKGAVYCTFTLYNRKGTGKPMAVHCQDFLDNIFSKFLPIKLSGNFHIQYQITETESGLILTIINNYPEVWHGRVDYLNPQYEIHEARDIWRERKISQEQKDDILRLNSLCCQPFDFLVLELNGKFTNKKGDK
jgi:hypothetical protein